MSPVVCVTRGSPATPSPPAPPMTGLAEWYDAAALLGYVNNDPVGSFTEQIHGNHATGSGGNRPTYKTGILNSLPILRFAGGQALVAAFASTLTQPWSVAVVVSISTDGKYIADTNDSGGANRWILTQGVFIGNSFSAYAGQYNNTSFSNTPPQAAAQYLAVFNGASSAVYKDGTSQASGDAGSASASGMTLGARYTVEDFLSGDVAEILVYDHALDGTERAALFSYLSAKWGVT